MTSWLKNDNDNRRFAFALTSLYFLVGCFSISMHEPWRDELQAWLIARDSTSVADLFSHLKYEGQPAVWHLCLMGISRVWDNPFGMQLFHLLLATGTTFLVALCSPFSRLQKCLFAFGYFSVFEYSVISRNYAIAILIIVVFSSLCRRRFELFVPIAVLLGILCHTCVQGAIVAFAFMTSLIVEYSVRRSRRLDLDGLPMRRVLIGSSLFLVAFGAFCFQLLPPADSGSTSGWKMDFNLARAVTVFSAIARSYLPVPVLQRDFWNSNFTEIFPRTPLIQVIFAGSLLFVSARILLKSTFSTSIFCLGTAGLILFAYLTHSGVMRHDGFLFVVWFVSIWIAKCLEDDGKTDRVSDYSMSWANASSFLTALLFVHFAGGLVALVQEYRFAFSGGRQAAAIIANSDLSSSTVLVCEPDYIGPAILPYLHRSSAWYLRGDRSGSFIVWDRERLRGEPESEQEILRRVTALTEDAVLAMNSPLLDVSEWKVDPLGRSSPAIVPDEQIFLYRVRRIPRSDWQYGFGELNADKSKVLGFQTFPYYQDGNWVASKKHDELVLGFCMLSRVGGHPGGDLKHCCIRRWMADKDCSIRVSGKVAHLQPQGDGIDAHLFISNQAVQSVHTINESRELKSDWREVKVGDFVDFVVDCCGDPLFDQFDCRIIIEQHVKGEKGRQWVSDGTPVLGGHDVLSAGWHYGWGQINDQRTELIYFELFKNFQNDTWCGKSGIPDAELGWSMLTRGGGHPGGDLKHCCIRRWVANSECQIKITSNLIHSQADGDGVNGHIFYQKRLIKSVHAHNNSKPFTTDWIPVESGAVVDFVVDCVGSEQFDEFDWRISIEQRIGASRIHLWNSDTQFSSDQ